MGEEYDARLHHHTSLGVCQRDEFHNISTRKQEKPWPDESWDRLSTAGKQSAMALVFEVVHKYNLQGKLEPSQRSADVTKGDVPIKRLQESAIWQGPQFAAIWAQQALPT
eukprot:jgi/Mesen1/8926/ME000548S08443